MPEPWSVWRAPRRRWRKTGIAARQLGELDKARTQLTSVVDLYFAAHHDAGAARALCSLGITLHHQGNLSEAAAKLQEAMDLQASPALAADRAWTMHALAAVERDRGEAWTCLEPAVVDAGNARTQSALSLCDEAASLLASYGDRRGEDWARFLRGTLLPYASPGGIEVGTAVAQEELTQISRTSHPSRDGKLDDCIEAYQLLLERGVDLDAGWQAWRLEMVPSRHAREVMGWRWRLGLRRGGSIPGVDGSGLHDTQFMTPSS